MARLRRGKGRKKIQLKRIEDKKERAGSFTKRHGGLFKKAYELASLCGIEIAIIVFSLSGKPLSFGNPSVPFIIKKFLNPNQGNHSVTNLDKSCDESTMHELNQELNELNEQLANEKKQGQMLQERLKALGWDSYEKYVGSLGIHELMHLKCKLVEMKRHMEHNDDVINGSSSSNDAAEVDLSKISAPNDYLKL